MIRHEIVFGRAERDLLEPALFSYTARNASRAWFNLTSDMSSVIVTIILYEYITGKSTGILDAVGDTAGTAYGRMIDGWNAYRSSPEDQEEYHEPTWRVTLGFSCALECRLSIETAFCSSIVQPPLENHSTWLPTIQASLE